MAANCEKVISDLFAAWTRLNVEEVMSHFAEDAVWDNVPMSPAKGKQAIREMTQGFMKDMSAFNVKILKSLHEGNVVFDSRVDTITTKSGKKPGFRAYWRWKYRRCGGRSRIDREIRDLIRRMSEKNPLWGAPGIHGDLLMLAIEVTQSRDLRGHPTTTVARYMTRRRGHPRGLEDVPPQSCLRDRVHRSVRGSLHLLQTALGPGHSSSHSQATGEHQRNEQSDRRVDRGQVTDAFPWDEAP